MIEIHDPLDPQVDVYRALRGRESTDVLWAEGPTVVERLLRSRHRTRSVLATPALVERLAPWLAGRGDLPVFVATRALIAEIVGFDLHRGAIAVGDRPTPALLDEALIGAARIVLVEGVNDAENLGAIGRCARALGADAHVLDATCADPYYRRSVRVSMGELLHLPVVRSGATPDVRLAWHDTLDRIVAAGFDVWALTPQESAQPIGLLRPPPRLALLVGAEGPGLSAAMLERFTNVRIPMHHGVDSLNVGHTVAAALAVVQSSHA